MKKYRVNLKSEIRWLLLLLLLDLFFAFLVWLVAPSAFGSVGVIIVLFTALILLAGYWTDHIKQKKQREALQTFLSNPDEEGEQMLLDRLDRSWHPLVRLALTQTRENARLVKKKEVELQNYQEFIEAWTHEIKTPISLATLVLANHKEDMSPYVYRRMEHVRYMIGSDVEKILYYARMQAGHVDYRFEKLDVRECVQQCMEEFYGIFDEKGVELQLDLAPLQIVSDKKILIFMLAQLISNGFKYAATEQPIIRIASWRGVQDDGKIHLSIGDNGTGVPAEDLPFLFDKGFTGSHPDRQNATGMGLYFVKKYAEALSVEVNIGLIATSGKGFEVELVFPNIT